ncbi:MAG: hypothetical protein ACRDIC_19505 [bacterium]
MTRSLLVLATLMVSCSSSPALVATKGQTAAQQEADRQACDAEVGNDQGGALGGNTNAAIGFFGSPKESVGGERYR